MHAILFIGGDPPPRQTAHSYLRTADCVIAADSGAHTAELFGVSIDILIGDMDSIGDGPQPEAAEVVRYPRDKDYTDTELGLREARRRGADDVTIIGGGGGRLDHLLGIYQLFNRSEPPRAWLSSQGSAFYVDAEIRLNLPTGSLISVFPLGEGEVRLRSRGLHWPLNALHWRLGDCGISNVSTAPEIVVSPECGAALVVVPCKEG